MDADSLIDRPFVLPRARVSIAVCTCILPMECNLSVIPTFQDLRVCYSCPLHVGTEQRSIWPSSQLIPPESSYRWVIRGVRFRPTTMVEFSKSAALWYRRASASNSRMSEVLLFDAGELSFCISTLAAVTFHDGFSLANPMGTVTGTHVISPKLSFSKRKTIACMIAVINRELFVSDYLRSSFLPKLLLVEYCHWCC
eukprot:scaffold2204_cov166-Amphora_coffeaeformis.AAC.27